MPSMTRATNVLAVCALAALVGFTAAAQPAAAAVRSTPACAASDLSAKATGSGAGMSQPAVYITVTNTSGSSCILNGYPTITRAVTKNGRQAIAVTKGAVMNAPQAKPKRIVVKPGGHAWFALGAATAYDPPVVTFTRISFSTAAGASVGDRAVTRISLQASAPQGKPFPLGVTAFMPGVGMSE